MKRYHTKFPYISTRSFYDRANGKRLKTKSYNLYPKNYFEKLYGIKEFTIMVHGMRNNRASSLKKFRIAKRRLKKLGYDYPIIGYSYDANTKGAHLKSSSLKAIRVGQKIAKQNGINLSKFILDFKKKSPLTKIRLIGHSLGTELIFSTLRILSRNKDSKVIESVHFFGSSLPCNVVTNQNAKFLQKVVIKKIKNYYSPDDEVLKQSLQEGSVKNPLGLVGAGGKKGSVIQKRVFPKNHRFASYAAILKSYP